jgi:hypothetical protein
MPRGWTSVWCVAAAVLSVAPTAVSSAERETCQGVVYRGTTYVALHDLAKALGGSVELTDLGRILRVKEGQRQWQIANGGDRIVLPDGKERPLKLPVLVIAGKHFIPLEECAEPLGYSVERGPPAALVVGRQRLAIEAKNIDSKHQSHTVECLEPVHEFVSVKAELPARRMLLSHSAAETVRVGTTLVVRRKLTLDGKASLIVTDCQRALESYVVAEQDLREKTQPGKPDGTAWAACRAWFDREAASAAALRSAAPEKHRRAVAVTVDLCWSLRAYEEKFLQSLPAIAQAQGQPIHPVMFVSGRWLEQHPEEMHALVELDEKPGVEIIWGLHSWSHPKSGGFMNDFSPDELRRDTLLVEQRLLEWGIVPSAYYRFPGLIHDRLRLEEILKLDLLPIDCDSWMALVRPARPEPFYHPARDGSIILIHGNGNEKPGIERMNEWLKEHGDFRWAPLNEFLPRE